MDKEILYVVLPCYNEEENISSLIMEWNRQEERFRDENILLKIIVINDGSKDNTLAIAEGMKKIYDNIIILNHETNKGLGEALNTGINYAALRKEKGFLCIMDADMTHDPDYVHSMISRLKEDKLHCVIASRYRKNSRVEGLSLYRKFLSYGARVIYTIKLRVPHVRDYTCGYRLYSLEAIGVLHNKYKGKIVSESGFACMMELLLKLSDEGFKIGEVPFVLKYQQKGGQSKMRVWNTVYRSLLVVMKF